MTDIVLFSEIVEDNGKTIRENNLAITHKIPLNSVVEVELDDYYDEYTCLKGIARLYVVSHDRDCDGTPLYGLGTQTTDSWESLCHSMGHDPDISHCAIFSPKRVLYRDFMGYRHGYSEKSLKVIKKTE